MSYVRDPVNRRFFRLGHSAGLACDLMDGQRDTAAIATELSLRFELAFPVTAVDKLVDKLGQLGFLVDGKAPPRPRSIRGGPFFLIVPLFDPDRMLDRLRAPLRALTSLPVLVLLGLGAVGGASALLTLGGKQALGALGGYSSIDLWVSYAVVTLAVLGHELAHAAALKRFGGAVHEMGIVLIYFLPCFYCNVSDAYLLPRRQRLWVSFAGIFFELGLWGLAVGVALTLGVDAGVGRVAALTAAAVGVKGLLFNLNPLIKLDGYYLLTDLLQIPNLRQRAFHLLTARLTGRELPFSTAAASERSTRAILLGYAVLASAFLLLVFVFVCRRLLDFVQDPTLDLPALVLLVLGLFLLLRGLRFGLTLWRGGEGEPRERGVL